MTDSNDKSESSHDSAEHPERPSGSQGFRIGNVVKVVTPLVLLGVGVVVFFGYFDGLTWLSDLVKPSLVSATGQIIYHGKPLEGAQVTTRHSNGQLRESVGWTDAEGRFTLRTDIDGYVEGAYAGEHRVKVTSFEVINAPASPPLITPQKYASFETTPLRITVSRIAEENEYVLTLEGDAPERPNPGGGSEQQASGGGFDPETIVGRVFENYDQDGDQQLSADEMQAIEADRVERIRQADANEDGVVQRNELLQAFSASLSPE